MENSDLNPKSGYGLVYQSVMRNKNLSIEAKAIYAYLSSFAGNKGECYPKKSLILSDLKISEKRFDNHFKILLENGYICKKRVQKNGRYSNNLYIINSAPYQQNTDMENTDMENTDMENTDMENTDMENGGTNNNIFNNNNINNNNINNNTYCSEPLQAHEPEVNQELENQEDLKDKEVETPVITLILNDKSEYPIYQKDMDKWKDIYPNVDIDNEFRKIKGWCIANPTKRKTLRGVNRFINNWLSKEQDKGKSSRQNYNSNFYYSGYENTSPTDGFSTEF